MAETLAKTSLNGKTLELSRSDEPSGTVVLHFRGRLDADTAGPIWDRALAAAPPKGGNLAVDAAELSYCDGAGITLLLDLRCQQTRHGGQFELRDLRDDFLLLLDLIGSGVDVDQVTAGPKRESIVEYIGAQTANFLRDLRELTTYVGLLTEALFAAVRHPTRVRWSEVLEVSTSAGAFALPVVMLLGFVLGWVMAFQASHIMHQYGADNFMAAMIAPAMVRELGPLMTTIVLAARSGSSFAATIGTMKVNEEIDALTTMGLDPVRFLVAPRVIAAVIVTPLLTAFSNLAGIVGGAIVSTTVLQVPLVVYTNQLQQVVRIEDIISGNIKAMVFGILVAAIGCIRGLQTRGSAAGVGASTTSAVVSGIVLIALADAVLAVLYRLVGW